MYNKTIHHNLSKTYKITLQTGFPNASNLHQSGCHPKTKGALFQHFSLSSQEKNLFRKTFSVS